MEVFHARRHARSHQRHANQLPRLSQNVLKLFIFHSYYHFDMVKNSFQEFEQAQHLQGRELPAVDMTQRINHELELPISPHSSTLLKLNCAAPSELDAGEGT